MTSAIRLRRLIVEDNPVIESYDEAQFREQADVRPSDRAFA